MRDDEFKDEEGKVTKSQKKPRGLLVFLIITTVIALLLYGSKTLTTSGKVFDVPHTEFLQVKADGHITELWINGYEVEGQLVPNYKIGEKEEAGKYEKIRTEFPDAYIRDIEGLKEIEKYVEPQKVHHSPPNPLLYQVLINLIPWLILIMLVWWFFSRQVRSMSGDPRSLLNFGRSRARLMDNSKRKITFDNVAGIDEAKDEVTEIIEYLKDPTKFQKLGGRIPRGVLLVGPPGTGKTLLAKAIAGEADVPFFNICGSDFVEMFVGVGASRVRDLFEQAKKNSPCIVFLDEIDAVGRRWGSGLGGGHDEREQTLNAILVEMDGFDTDTGVIVMAATNRPDVLDPALLRPGRFDREIVIDMPDVKGREDILKVHAKKVKLAKDADLKVIAKTTPMFSGADLEAIINESALLAVMKKRDAIVQEDLEEARDKVRWGRAKRSRVMDEEDKKVTAYHESGHTLIAELLPEVEPLHKVTIIPRGLALGATMTLPEKDRYHMQKKYLLGTITMFFGGRVAEETFCGDISAGARDDIKKATELARMMVCEWGMSEAVGLVNYSENEDTIFLGREITRTRNHSEKTAVEIDAEVRKILDTSYNRAKDLIQNNKGKIEMIAKALLKYETLSGDDVKKILAGEDIDSIRAEANAKAVAAEEKEKEPEKVEGQEKVWKPFPNEKPLTGPAQA